MPLDRASHTQSCKIQIKASLASTRPHSRQLKPFFHNISSSSFFLGLLSSSSGTFSQLSPALDPPIFSFVSITSLVLRRFLARSSSDSVRPNGLSCRTLLASLSVTFPFLLELLNHSLSFLPGSYPTSSFSPNLNPPPLLLIFVLYPYYPSYPKSLSGLSMINSLLISNLSSIPCKSASGRVTARRQQWSV